MKIKGKIVVTPLMSEMKVGQKGYLTTDAILVINGDMVFITEGYSISEIKDGKYVLPIERIGPEKEDFEIDFFISRTFFNTQVSEEELQKLKENKNLIGPYEVTTEIEQPFNYRTQAYPRMDLFELLQNFIEINKAIQDYPHEEKYVGDKKTLRELITEKLKKLPLAELRTYDTYFLPVSQEEEDNGVVSYVEDKKLANVVENQINTLLGTEDVFKNMSIKELDTEMKAASTAGNYELSAHLRDLISNKTNAVKNN